MTTVQIMPGIRHVKQPSNIGSKGPVMPTEPGQEPTISSGFEAGLPETAGRGLSANPGDNSNLLGVDDLALELVARIDEGLTRGVKHYRTRGGQLLTCLDEVVRALLCDDLEEVTYANS